jgi:hypothetical protein
MEPLQILAMNEDGKKNMKCKKEEIKGEEGKKEGKLLPSCSYVCTHMLLWRAAGEGRLQVSCC